jgi:hypothetical protein
MLRLVMAVAACTVIRCGSGFVAPDSQAFPDALAGTWRSVTPSLEFMRLSVFSTSSETCALVGRLTFSGVAWEGGGRIVGDSLVLRMSTAGSAVPAGTVVVHPSGARTVRVQVRPESGATMDLTFVRDD